MKRFAVASLFLVAAAGLATAEKPEAALAQLKGEYSLKAGYKNGKPVTDADKARFEKMVITDKEITVYEKGKADPAGFTIDAAKTPAHINITPPNGNITLKGIYKLEKSELTMVFSIAEARPTDFKGDQPGMMKLVLTRKGAEKSTSPPKK